MDDDELVAYLSGDGEAPLDPGTRAEVDQVRALLADPSLWTEPPADLEERVVRAVTQARSATAAEATEVPDNVTPLRARRRHYAILGVAAALLVGAGLVIGLTGRDAATVVAIDLQGTALSGDASGEVTMTKTTSGWRIELSAEGLPRRADGDFYEAWLRNGEGVLVSIGTFNEPRDVTLWSGVGPTTHPTLTVTREVDNGDPSSSGEVVLAGTSGG